jgi:hypothetical protein
MQLKELLASLPNGLHDATLRSLRVDYVRQSASFDIDFELSDPEVAGNFSRPGCLVLAPLVFCFVVPVRGVGDQLQPLYLDALPLDELRDLPPDLPAVPPDAFGYCFIDRIGNSCIFVAAKGASLEWTGDVKQDA